MRTVGVILPVSSTLAYKNRILCRKLYPLRRGGSAENKRDKRRQKEMTYYESSLIGMKRVLAKAGDSLGEGYVDGFIGEWRLAHKTDSFEKAFSKNGVFADYSFASPSIKSEELRFWCTQLFGGLVAMALQLVRFSKAGREITIDFMKKNFGHPSEVISGVKCTSCGAKEINAADIDKYITPLVVSRAIIEGIEGGCMAQKVEELLDGTSKHLIAERKEAVLRAENSKVNVSEERVHPVRCSKCGKASLEKCRFLKSLKSVSFVSLSR